MLVREFGEEEKKGKSFPRLYLVLSFYSRGLIFFKLTSHTLPIYVTISVYTRSNFILTPSHPTIRNSTNLRNYNRSKLINE